jgi:UDP-N-acetylmuramate--alanine ligase
VPFYGTALLCVDDPPTRAIAGRVRRRVVTYGLDADAQIRARGIEQGPLSSGYVALHEGGELGEIALAVPGVHNVVNSLAAIGVGLELGIPFERIKEGLESFRGVDRRFQVRGEAAGVTVIDDYGHHPTEIRATLRALRTLAGERRTLVLFQPHRYTRTRALWDEFCTAFEGADLLLLADIYAASEDEIPGVTAEALSAAIAARGGRAVYAGSVRSAAERLLREVRPGDVVLTLGAGNVHLAGEELLRQRGKAA